MDENKRKFKIIDNINDNNKKNKEINFKKIGLNISNNNKGKNISSKHNPNFENSLQNKKLLNIFNLQKLSEYKSNLKKNFFIKNDNLASNIYIQSSNINMQNKFSKKENINFKNNIGEKILINKDKNDNLIKENIKKNLKKIKIIR